MAAPLTLPEGRSGQLAAVGLLVAGLLLVWFGAVLPAGSWYGGRAAQLSTLQLQAAHMARLQQQLPQLRAQLAAAATRNSSSGALLPGGSDEIAGANLQSAVQNLAAQAGTGLDSATIIPAQPTGALRRIGVQISFTATWPVLIALLTAIDDAQPRMIADNLTITAAAQIDPRQETSLQAGLTVSAFRANSGP